MGQSDSMATNEGTTRSPRGIAKGQLHIGTTDGTRPSKSLSASRSPADVTNILITWDVDPLTPEERMRESIPAEVEEVELQVKAIRQALAFCDALGAKSTFFITASLASQMSAELDRLIKAGHQVGCHGLSHEDWEDYATLEPERQREALEKSTRMISEVVGEKPKAFRAPRVSSSSVTLRLLEDLGYAADSSVSAGRFDLSSSFFRSPAQILAPQRPYHPHPLNRFKEGKSRIWEIPVSARIMPFTSTALTSLGLRFMKGMLDHYSSRSRTAVYLIHPVEFLASLNGARPPRGWFLPSRNWLVHGVPFRYLFFRKEGTEIYRDNMSLFKYAKERWNADFVTLEILLSKLGPGGR